MNPLAWMVVGAWLGAVVYGVFIHPYTASGKYYRGVDRRKPAKR